MSVEDVKPEVPGRRNFVGWVVLAILFSLLILSSVSQAIKSGDQRPEAYVRENAILRSVSSNMEMMRRLSQMGQQNLDDRVKDLNASLDEPISNLVNDAESKPAAARLYAVMRTEQKEKIPDKMLEVLRNSKAPIDQTYYEIYRAEKIDPARSQRLALALPKQPFSNQLAAIHALEKGGSSTARQERIDAGFVVRIGLVTFVGLGLFFGGLVAWAVYLNGRKNNRFAPKGHPIGRVTLLDADRLAIRGAQILFAFVLISSLLPAIDRYVIPLGKTSAIAAGVTIIGVIVALSQFGVLGKRITLESIGVRRDRIGKDILWGIAGFLAEIPVVATLAALGLTLFSFLPAPSHPANEAISQAGGIIEILPILLMASILAPIWEEILFRGILFPALGRISGSVVSGALYSSLLFGFIHPQGPMLAFALAGVGAVSCGLAYQTRSLIPSIVLHILHNSALMIAALLLL